MENLTISKTKNILFCGVTHNNLISEIDKSWNTRIFNRNDQFNQDNLHCIVFSYETTNTSLKEIKILFPNIPIIVILETLNDDILSELSFYNVDSFHIIDHDFRERLLLDIKFVTEKNKTKFNNLFLKAQDSNIERLTSREKEILSALSKGKTNKEISTIVNLSPATVRNHLYEIFKKLKVTNRTQAVSIFLDNK